MDSDKMKSVPVSRSEITPEHVYFSRRRFLKLAALVGTGAVLAACGVPAATTEPAATPTPMLKVPNPESGLVAEPEPDATAEPGPGKLTPEDAVTSYNNFYEFTTDKQRVAKLAEGFKTSPWEVEVYGLVNQPKTYSMEDILQRFTQEERVFRMRCVEGWSMVIPWQGFRLSELLNEVEPTSEAKYVRFEAVYDPDELPGQQRPAYPWPYQEGLRLDEAQNDLTILATGLYGKPLPPQSGAPIRLVVPWKYGFKSIKSIVKIELVAEEPSTLWSSLAPQEYGFYANVNPEVPHPRWSQATERRIGDPAARIPTLMFNGYGEEVAYLYEGMDLAKYY